MDRYNSRKPDFVNKKGTKWWIDRDLTEYAKSKLKAKTVVYLAETPEGDATFVVLQSDIGPIRSNRLREDILIFIDILAMDQEREV